ncbi:MAG: periplasmic heavy metal sensor [Limisphaerales bacterium]
MKKGATILLLGLLLATAAFCGFYYLGTASCRRMMRGPQPELAWLKKEFKLSDAEFARISQLHAAYLPQCAARCRRIEEESQRLRQLLSQATNMTPEIQFVLAERAGMRAECEAEMMKHFLDVSRTMPPEQGRRYLAWVERQTFLHGQAMEDRHHTEGGSQPAHQHRM